MNILTITYYKDFARYFSYLEEEIKLQFTSCEFTNLVLYPCAKSYFSTKGIASTLLPLTIKGKGRCIFTDSNYYREYNLSDLIKYSVKALCDSSSKTVAILKSRAIGYIDYFEDLFSTSTYDFIICSGDTRIPIETCIAVAKRHQIKIWYFEQGPFGTTILDENGVNTNASFSGTTGYHCKQNDIDLDQQLSRILESSGGKYWVDQRISAHDRLVDASTLIWLYPPRALQRILPLELSSGTSFFDFILQTIKNILKRKFKKPASPHSKNTEPYIALLLQVPHDAQMLVHSPHYADVSSLVRDVIDNAPEGFSVAIREHPLHMGRYGSAVYSAIKFSNRAYLDNEANLNELIDGATAVIVNNSTAGLDAMRRSKTVVVLGQAYYANSDVVYHLKSRLDLKRLLQESVCTPIDPNVIRCYLNWLLNEHLIPGHFQDMNLKNANFFIKKLFKVQIHTPQMGYPRVNPH